MHGIDAQFVGFVFCLPSFLSCLLLDTRMRAILSRVTADAEACVGTRTPSSQNVQLIISGALVSRSGLRVRSRFLRGRKGLVPDFIL